VCVCCVCVLYAGMKKLSWKSRHFFVNQLKGFRTTFHYILHPVTKAQACQPNMCVQVFTVSCTLAKRLKPANQKCVYRSSLSLAPCTLRFKPVNQRCTWVPTFQLPVQKHLAESGVVVPSLVLLAPAHAFQTADQMPLKPISSAILVIIANAKADAFVGMTVLSLSATA